MFFNFGLTTVEPEQLDRIEEQPIAMERRIYSIIDLMTVHIQF